MASSSLRIISPITSAHSPISLGVKSRKKGMGVWKNRES